MNNKTNIVKSDLSTVDVEVLCYFQKNADLSTYLYYTLNEVMGVGANSTVKIYVGKTKNSNESLNTEISSSEWDELKGIMAETLKGVDNDNITYLPVPDSVNIISEQAIGMPVNYDYVNKQKEKYLSSVKVVEDVTSTSEPVLENEIKPILMDSNMTSAGVSPVDSYIQNSIENEVINNTEQVGMPSVDQDMVGTGAAVVEQSILPSETDNSQKPPMVQVEEPKVREEQSANGPIIPDMSEINTTEVPATSESHLVENNQAPAESKVVMEKINIVEIEKKYDDMFNSLKELMDKEIEAAKRYNATLELSQLHNNQHASYVANEQIKTAEQVQENISVAPVTSEPAKQILPNNTETNWFDIQAA